MAICNQDWLQTEEERRRTDIQTKCRTRQIVDMSGRLMDKRNRKRVLVEWCLCMEWIQSIWSQDDCWKSRRDDFARISTRINGRLVSVCIAPLSVCIYIAVTAISFICIGSKPNEARSFLNAETSIEEEVATLASQARMHFIIPLHCVPTHFLQFSAIQRC